jgi:hypothetical protein
MRVIHPPDEYQISVTQMHAQFIVGDVASHAQIAKKEIVLNGSAFERHTQEMPDGTVRTVRADEIRARHTFARSIRTRNLHVDARLAFGECAQLGFTLNASPLRLNVLDQKPLRLRLRQKQHEGIAAGNLFERSLHRTPAFTVDADAAQTPPVFDGSLRDLVPLELFERARLHDQRLRVQRSVRRLVDDAVALAHTGRFRCHCQTGRPRTADENVDIRAG